MTIVWWSLAIIGGAIFLLVAAGLYFATVLRWADERTVGLNYYGLPAAERETFRRRIAFHARVLRPVLWLTTQKAFDFRNARIQYKGVAAPSDSCRAEGFAKAEAYTPRTEDVFVVTQMKCGTTWMQHVVYQIVHRGHGNLVETGGAMYAISPWIEGRKSVSHRRLETGGLCPANPDYQDPSAFPAMPVQHDG